MKLSEYDFHLCKVQSSVEVFDLQLNWIPFLASLNSAKVLLKRLSFQAPLYSMEGILVKTCECQSYEVFDCLLWYSIISGNLQNFTLQRFHNIQTSHSRGTLADFQGHVQCLLFDAGTSHFKSFMTSQK